MSLKSETSAKKPNTTLRFVVIGIAALAVIGVLALVILMAIGGSGEASEAISAPPLSGENVLSIVSSASEVRFSLDETLAGRPVRVVGRTSEIAGDIRVDFADPSASEVGTIRINARTLATDNEFRNRALRGLILQSVEDRFEFSEFVPTGITGLPATVTTCQTFNFQVTGSLTVRDITQEVTFDLTVTPVSTTWIEGYAAATVTREMFQLTIPNAPGVANVSDEVLLEFDFVATPGGTIDATPEVNCPTPEATEAAS